MADLTQKQILAEEARQILESSAFSEAFFDIREQLVQEIEQGGLTDKDRDRLMLSLQLLVGLKAQLMAKINDALIEQIPTEEY